MAKSNAKVTIKKYANRRLYDTESSAYITLDRLAAMVREGPYGEYTGYRVAELDRGVLVNVTAITHRDDPIHTTGLSKATRGLESKHGLAHVRAEPAIDLAGREPRAIEEDLRAHDRRATRAGRE